MFGVKFSSSTSSSNWPPEPAASTVSPSNSCEPIERQSKVATLRDIQLLLANTSTSDPSRTPSRLGRLTSIAAALLAVVAAVALALDDRSGTSVIISPDGTRLAYCGDADE
jgi:hypothetical protein